MIKFLEKIFDCFHKWEYFVHYKEIYIPYGGGYFRKITRRQCRKCNRDAILSIEKTYLGLDEGKENERN